VLREPDLTGLSGRIQARWDAIVVGDWIEAYDFLAPGRKQAQSLGAYIDGKDYHKYRDPSVPVLIGADGDQAFYGLKVVWKPTHPQIPQDPDPSQTMDIIETWFWHEGRWSWQTAQRRREFLAMHPDLPG